MSKPRRISTNWSVWFFWIMATTMGWVLGGILVPAMALPATGFATGILQWLVLEGRIAKAWGWIVVSAAGWLAGWVLILPATLLGLEFLDGLILGTAVGLAQWLMLRHEVKWSGWWIPVSAVGWTTGLRLMPGFMLTGTMAGAITGLALDIMLRNPKPVPVEPD